MCNHSTRRMEGVGHVAPPPTTDATRTASTSTSTSRSTHTSTDTNTSTSISKATTTSAVPYLNLPQRQFINTNYTLVTKTNLSEGHSHKDMCLSRMWKLEQSNQVTKSWLLTGKGRHIFNALRQDTCNVVVRAFKTITTKIVIGKQYEELTS